MPGDIAMSLQAQVSLPAGDSPMLSTASRTRQAEWPVCGAILFAVAGHLLIKFGLNALSKTAVAHQDLAHRLLAYLFQPAVFLGLGI